MANKRNTVAYFKAQSSATTAVIPSSATDGYVSIEAPDVTTGERELLESEMLSGSIGKKKPQLGFETASCSVSFEARSHGDSSNPTEPDFGAIYKSALGNVRTTVADVVGGTPDTTSFDVGTIGNFAVGDMLLIDNTTDGIIARFIKSISGSTITVNTAMDNAPTAGDVVYATVNYYPANDGHSHLTAGFYQGNSTSSYFEQVVGSLVTSLGLTAETGSIVKIATEMVGLFGARTATTAASHTPTYESVQGLTAFNIEVFFNNTSVCANSLEVSLANDVSDKKSFCTEKGKVGSIVRGRTITGKINPYVDGSIDYYTALNALTDYEVSIVIGKKDSGGFIVGQTIGIYLPQVNIIKDKTSDIDDNLIEDIEFSANTGSSGNELDVVMSFG